MTLPTHSGPEVPPPLTWERLVTAWTFEPLAVLAVALVGASYLAGVLALRRRGDKWSLARTAAFCGLGLGSLLVATTSALAVYDTTLLSVHMVQHMVLSMVAPVFLALGAPVTLALRTLPAGPRSALLRLLHSKVASVVASAPVAFALFVASPWVLYFTGWYGATLRSEALHGLLHLHFVVVGCLFFWPLLGLDPVPGRVAYPFRMLTLLATLPFHAFLGVTVMGMQELLAGDWYRALDRPWPPSPDRDQTIAGGILWASGDLIAGLLFAVVFVQWVTSSQREARREDRRLDLADAKAATAGDATPPR